MIWNLATCCVLMFFLLGHLNAQSSKKKIDYSTPNILLINIDDLGWKDLGFMGTEYYETPNIDALAKQGMIFTNGYASAANCAPSRASLMTGKWTTRHGIYTVGNSDRGKAKHRKLIPTQNKTILDESYSTIPKILQANGYVTCHAGKWHLSESPLGYGFATNIAGGHNGMPKSYYPPYQNVSIEKGKSKNLTDLIMEKTLSFIDTVSHSFFLYYAPYAVHVPIEPIDSLLEKYQNKTPWNGQQNAAYATMIENLDKNIGLLIKKLKDRDVFDDTLIIFTSDNGGLYGITNQKPLRAGKGAYYEGGIREPFFFVWTDKIKPNTSSDIPITNLDVFPTILNTVDIDYEENLLDGNNLLPILQGRKRRLHRPLYWHFPIYLQAYNVADNENRDALFRTRPGSVVRYKDWKLHYYFEDNGIELYNLSNDIGERKNVASIHPRKAKKLLAYLEKWWVETDAPIPKTPNSAYVQ